MKICSLSLIALLLGVAHAAVTPSIPPGTIACNNTVAAAAPAGCGAIPAGVTADASLLQSGILAAALLPGSSVRYPAAASVSIASTDNGNVVNESFGGACAVTLPQVGTNGITAGSFQTLLINSGTTNCSVTPTTSTINSTTVLFLPGGTWYLITADNTTSPGNYVAVIGGGFSSSNQGTLTFPNGIKASSLVVNGSSTKVSGQGWMDQSAGSHHLVFGTDLLPALDVDGNQNASVYGVPVATQPAALPYPTVTLSGNCSAAETTGNTLTATMTNGSSSLTAVNTLAAGQTVAFSGTVPLPYLTGTTYYVIATGLSGAAFQVSLTSGGASVGNVTGTTGTVTTTITNGTFNHTGGLAVGGFTLPAGGTYSAGACTMTLTFPTALTTGYTCRGADEVDNAQLTQSAHTATTCAMAKATAPTAGAYISYIAFGQGKQN